MHEHFSKKSAPRVRILFDEEITSRKIWYHFRAGKSTLEKSMLLVIQEDLGL